MACIKSSFKRNEFEIIEYELGQIKFFYDLFKKDKTEDIKLAKIEDTYNNCIIFLNESFISYFYQSQEILEKLTNKIIENDDLPKYKEFIIIFAKKDILLKNISFSNKIVKKEQLIQNLNNKIEQIFKEIEKLNLGDNLLETSLSKLKVINDYFKKEEISSNYFKNEEILNRYDCAINLIKEK